MGDVTETFVIGDSEATEAEFGARANDPVTLLTFSEHDEVVCIQGFQTFDEAKQVLKQEGLRWSYV